MTLSVQPLSDQEQINAILSDPWIAAKLVRDDGAAAFVAHPLLSYHGAYVDGRLVGLFIAVRFTRWEVEVHGALLRPAVPHSRALGRLFLHQVFADPDVQRATAYVVATLPSAANWCRRMGFVDEGRRRDACRVNGAPVDVLILGLTRGEWSEFATRRLLS